MTTCPEHEPECVVVHNGECPLCKCAGLLDKYRADLDCYEKEVTDLRKTLAVIREAMLRTEIPAPDGLPEPIREMPR